VDRIAERYPIQELKRRIIARDSDVLAFVRAQGFIVSDAEFADVATQLDATEKMIRMAQAFQNFTFKTRFINRYSILAKQYTPRRVMKKLHGRSGAEWFVEQCKKIPLPVDYSVEEIRRLAGEFIARSTLRDVEKKLATRGDWREGIDKKTLWLMMISFVVCAVGIANAMLISVAERFREIATMKCLGALDGFVMTLFVLESGIFGLAGGALGVIMGFLLSLLKEFMAFGRYTFLYFPAMNVLQGAGGALVIGMFIATVAALYPSWVASRMAPMEAMRVE
jgi:ABC-type antimicrobial peptide transport system permease subunit